MRTEEDEAGLGFKTRMKAPDRGQPSEEEPDQGLLMQCILLSTRSWGWTPAHAGVFACNLMRREVPGKMGVSSFVGHAWLRQCGLAAVAQEALMNGCVWE